MLKIAEARHLPALLRERAPSIVVGMPMRDMASTVTRAVVSVLDQREVRGRLLLVVFDDGSTDASLTALAPFARDPRLLVVRGRWGKAWAVRNALLDGASAARTGGLVLRLDADDTLADASVVASVERRFRSTLSLRGRGRRPEPLALLAGNALSANGRLLPRVNVPDGSLLTRAGLGDRLARMAAGDPLAELPSCNFVLRAGLPWRYTAVSSAEDHWLTVAMLTEARGRVALLDDRLYCTYSLSGALTQRNHATARHIAARSRLFDAWNRRAGRAGRAPC
ncbi:MAG: hypothetical protein JWM10_3030 [Myxococcaceae bacterium]|nr:hypothetical protein [Myxococcaceae bacterium]